MCIQDQTRKLYLAARLRKLGLVLFIAVIGYSTPTGVWAQVEVAPQHSPQDASGLLARLKTANADEAKRLARDIRRGWSRSGSASADLLLKRGRDALRAKKPQIAIEHLTALTDHAPDFAEGWHLRASAYYQSNLYGPALDDLSRTLSLNPDHFEALQGLGAIFEQLGDFTQAHAVYTRVLTIHPHHSGVLEALQRLEPKVKGPKL